MIAYIVLLEEAFTKKINALDYPSMSELIGCFKKVNLKSHDLALFSWQRSLVGNRFVDCNNVHVQFLHVLRNLAFQKRGLIPNSGLHQLVSSNCWALELVNFQGSLYDMSFRAHNNLGRANCMVILGLMNRIPWILLLDVYLASCLPIYRMLSDPYIP